MLYYTSRSDLKPYIEAGHHARSRAFFDLLTGMRNILTKAWTLIKLAPRGGFGADTKHRNQPSSAMHA